VGFTKGASAVVLISP